MDCNFSLTHATTIVIKIFLGSLTAPFANIFFIYYVTILVICPITESAVCL